MTEARKKIPIRKNFA